MRARPAGLQIIFHRRLSELVIARGVDYPVVYFDRDGVLNRFTRGKYINTRADVVPMPTAAARAEPLRWARVRKFTSVIEATCENQLRSGIIIR